MTKNGNEAFLDREEALRTSSHNAYKPDNVIHMTRENFEKHTPVNLGKAESGVAKDKKVWTAHSGYSYDISEQHATREETYFAEDLGLDADAAREGTKDAEVQAAAEALQHHRLVYRFAKRTLDIAFSAAVLVLFCWLFAIIAIAVKVDDPKGPVIFKQRRVGKLDKNGNPTYFNMYKFRSMVVDAEDRLEELRELNEKTGPVFKIKQDPRITRVGRVIRKLSLDELPQFVNVIKGDCSIVGPRPALPAEEEAYNERQRQRLLVRPGITCYWQTRKNRDSITFDEWVDLDLMYIKRCSIWSDVKLIIQTVGVVLTAQGN